MSRIAKQPVTVPAAVEITENGQQVTVKGPKGTLLHNIHALVEMTREDGELKFRPRDESKSADAMTGTIPKIKKKKKKKINKKKKKKKKKERKSNKMNKI